MNHNDHVALLRNGVTAPGGIWADFGAGNGAFTLALAELVGPTAEIYAIDKKNRSLQQLRQSMATYFPGHKVKVITADFTHALDLPLLDGAIMANALHFLRRKDPVLQLIKGYLQPGARLILVEYNVDQGNIWVPYPLSYPKWEKLAEENGFVDTRLLATRPSRFLHEIYSAVSYKNE